MPHFYMIAKNFGPSTWSGNPKLIVVVVDFVQVTGSADEDQILLAIQNYSDKPNLLTKALNELFNLFRYLSVKRQADALQVSGTAFDLAETYILVILPV